MKATVKQALGFDSASVPAVVATRARVRSTALDARARWMLPFIDGRTRLGDVLERSGLPFDDARYAVGELVRVGIVALRPAPAAQASRTRSRKSA